MRKTKLTLSADDDLVKAAKVFAGEHGTTLSSMFSRFLQALLSRKRVRVPHGSVTRKLSGIAKMPAGKTDRDLLGGALAGKFGFQPPKRARNS